MKERLPFLGTQLWPLSVDIKVQVKWGIGRFFFLGGGGGGG